MSSIRFDEFFVGQPSIVVFFYTRCDNPFKCSLTVTKLARVQGLLAARGLAVGSQTAAITYDPAYRSPNRLSTYGKNRGVRMDARNRMLRAVDGNERLRAHFALGVSFIESLVNRHRIEAYVLDREGRIAASFERVRWDEHEVVNRAVEVLHEGPAAFAEGMTPALGGETVRRLRRCLKTRRIGLMRHRDEGRHPRSLQHSPPSVSRSFPSVRCAGPRI